MTATLPTGTLLTVREIELQARARCEALTRECLPGAIQEGHFLKCGSLGGERGSSLVVNLSGANRGMWRDWSSGDQGDMTVLVERTKFGGDRGEAVKWLKSWLGLDHLDPARVAQVRAVSAREDEARAEQEHIEAEAKKRGARALWLNGAPLSSDGTIQDTPASRYLETRGIRMEPLGHWPGALRYHPEVWNRDAGQKLPALVAQMILPTGEHVATHRTWLGRCRRSGGWTKADGADLGVPRGSAKKVLGKSGGAFVPLRKGASRQSMGQLRRPDELFVTEGIEDALTVAMCRPDARVVAAYSLGNLAAIAFPPTIATIVLVADRDDGEREQHLLERAIARQQARGHHVKLVMPPVGVKDVNAWLLAGAEAA